jgi:hypothetical protein
LGFLVIASSVTVWTRWRSISSSWVLLVDLNDERSAYIAMFCDSMRNSDCGSSLV